ncbi:hypothetical protein [Pelomonas cellulosilytica]|uniref:hypothetical protein n=1 Tax=Pelomonas cellulosilytica TaxID=2906762 RepID=UPI003B020301
MNDSPQLLARHPALAHTSFELPDTHLLYFVGSHVIVYSDQESAIAGVRILHQRVSVNLHR